MSLITEKVPHHVQGSPRRRSPRPVPVEGQQGPGGRRPRPGPCHVHDLYATYPDFHIDADAEQALLAEHDVIVFEHPVF